MNNIKKLTTSGILLSLALLLPFLTGQIPQIGSMISPMHIPILLCGFVCGWKYGLVVGLIAPGLRHLLFGMPPYPAVVAMTFELAAYGLSAGIIYGLLPQKKLFVYVSLIFSMIVGRLVWGISMYFISLTSTNINFGLSAFFAGAFINAVLAIILHITLIPILVFAIKKSGVLDR